MADEKERESIESEMNDCRLGNSFFSVYKTQKTRKERKVLVVLCVILIISRRKKTENKDEKSVFVMYEASATPMINTGGFNSQLSFYEYPPHKPYTNSTYQPLRPSHNLSTSVTLPESNRDQLLTSLQSLSLKIKTLEQQREVNN